MDRFLCARQCLMIRTDTTLDQDSVLTATVFVCTSCSVVSLSTTSLNFITPPLTWTAPFDARLVGKTLMYRSTEKLRKGRLPTDSCLNKFKASKLGPLHLDQSRVSKRLSMARAQSQSHVRRQSVFTNFRVAFCHCFAPCRYIASCDCCHDPFIVRSAQSTFHWFHSACTSVSMFTINADYCLFQCSCFPVFTSCLCVYIGSLCSYRVCSPITRSIIGSSPSSCSGVRDP